MNRLKQIKKRHEELSRAALMQVDPLTQIWMTNYLNDIAYLLEERRLNPTPEAADAFWKYWEENGIPHKHGYYESTWGAINAAIREGGLI